MDLERQTRPGFSGAAYRYIRATDKIPTYVEIADESDPLCRVKLFGGPGTWWIAAYDPDTRIAWGVAEIQERETGSFSMDELVDLRIPPFGLPVERDLDWTPKRVSAVLADR
jgi:Protein of unknown function (DUF2958)